MPILAFFISFWTAVVVALIGAGAVAATTEVQRREASKARSVAEAAERKRQQAIELEAGEYVELTEKQMKIQALQSQTRTLVELIDIQDGTAAPQIYTLPAAQSTDPLDRINAAIDDFIKGRR